MGQSKGKSSYWIETAKHEKRKVESSRQVRATSVDSTGEQNKMSNKRKGERKPAFVITASVEPPQVAGRERKCAARAPASRGHVSESAHAEVIDSECRHSELG